MTNDRSQKKIDASFTSIRRIFLLLITTILCYACAFFIPIVFLYEVSRLLHFSQILHLFIFSIAIVFAYLILVFSMIAFSALFIRLLKVRYTDGDYGTTVHDKTGFKLVFSWALYFPTYKVIGFLNLPPIKTLFLRLIGCKIGTNVVLAGDEWIFDPYVTEIGDNTTIGSRAIILGHVGESGRLHVKTVHIGNNVLIGADSLVMPGAVIEDNVILGAKSLVTKEQHLLNGKAYAGTPAREITHATNEPENLGTPKKPVKNTLETSR